MIRHVNNTASVIRLIGVTYVLLPYTEECVDQFPQYCPNPGIDVLAIWRIISNAGFSLSIIKTKTEEGTWAMLANNSADITVQSEITSLKNRAHLEVTAPISTDPPAFVIRRRLKTDLGNRFLLLQVCPWYIWLLSIGLSLFSDAYQVFSGYIMRHFCSQQQLRTKDWKKRNPLASGICSSRLCWSWTAVQIGMFGGALSIFLSVNKLHEEIPFRNLEEFSWSIYQNQCQVLTYSYIQLEYAHVFPTDQPVSETEARLKIAYQYNPPIIIPEESSTADETAAKWITKNDTCLCIVDYASRASYWKKMNSMLSVIVDISASGIPYVYYMRKSLPLSVKQLLRTSFSAGAPAELYDRIVAKYGEGADADTSSDQPTSQQAANQMNRDQSENMLTLYHLTEAFAALVIALMTAVLIFLAETMLCSKTKPKLNISAHTFPRSHHFGNFVSYKPSNNPVFVS